MVEERILNSDIVYSNSFYLNVLPPVEEQIVISKSVTFSCICSSLPLIVNYLFVNTITPDNLRSLFFSYEVLLLLNFKRRL